MAGTLKFIYAQESQILALIPSSSNWVEQAFYYPDDKPYFFQVRNGIMKKYSGDSSLTGVGCKLNGEVMGGVKTLILADDSLYVPENYEYNAFFLNIDGSVDCDGVINIM